MANARKYAGSPFISLKDLKDKPPLLEKIEFVTEEVDGKFGDRLVATFESGKRLSLNATSVGILMRDIDPDYDRWVGHRVKVHAAEIDFKNGKTTAVLVEPIDVEKPPSKATEPAAGKPRGDMDDEIPF
jgi:hypothetical protein